MFSLVLLFIEVPDFVVLDDHCSNLWRWSLLRPSGELMHWRTGYVVWAFLLPLSMVIVTNRLVTSTSWRLTCYFWYLWSDMPVVSTPTMFITKKFWYFAPMRSGRIFAMLRSGHCVLKLLSDIVSEFWNLRMLNYHVSVNAGTWTCFEVI